MSFAISIVVSGLAAFGLGRFWGSHEWWRSAATAPAIGLGAALAVVSIAVVALLPYSWHRAAYATLLMGIAAEYTGFALIDRRLSRVVLEAAWAATTGVAPVAGLLLSPAWLTAGFVAHVGWDLTHHVRIKLIDTRSCARLVCVGMLGLGSATGPGGTRAQLILGFEGAVDAEMKE